jgi:hypothetical protein
MARICFMVTSVAYPAHAPLAYSATRSIYSGEERLAQTKKTIASIRERAPQARILLVDGGERDPAPELAALVDAYAYKGGDRLARWACRSAHKSMGEAALTLAGIRRLPAADLYVKISGRYRLADTFDMQRFARAGFSFRYARPDFAYTCLYSCGANEVSHWKKALFKTLFYAPLDYPLEYTLQKHVGPRNITRLACLGVEGTDGTNGAAVCV